jgi:hypothetical protein
LTDKPYWRSDINALIFPIEENTAICAVHYGAFRTLLGFDPTPNDCLAYFGDREEAFRQAASVKAARNAIPPGTNLHLTSRDVARKLLELKPREHGEQ